MMRKIYKKVSLKSRFINRMFALTPAKKNYKSEEKVKEFIKEYKKTIKKYNIPTSLGMKKEILFDTEIYSYNGTIENNTGKFLVYIHGGSFVEEALDYQIKFASRIAEKTQSTLIMPRYKLIPNANYNDLYELMNNLYKKILSTNCDEINFLGDSSGGGFILAYSMFLRDNNKRLPKNILMLSPWVE